MKNVCLGFGGHIQHQVVSHFRNVLCISTSNFQDRASSILIFIYSREIREQRTSKKNIILQNHNISYFSTWRSQRWSKVSLVSHECSKSSVARRQIGRENSSETAWIPPAPTPIRHHSVGSVQFHTVHVWDHVNFKSVRVSSHKLKLPVPGCWTETPTQAETS